jgi:hypothetical protein
MNLVDIFARLWFALGLFIVFGGLLLIAGGFAWQVFRYFHPVHETQAPTPVPETDLWYYRQRHRRAIRLLLDRVERLSKELEDARQEIARLKGYRTTPRRE